MIHPVDTLRRGRPARFPILGCRHFQPRFTTIILALSAITLPLAAQHRTLLDFGHLDIDWRYSAGQWSVKLVWDEDFPELEVDPPDGVLIAKDLPFSENQGSRWERPPGELWDQTGAAEGDPVWLLPSSSTGPILEPGFATYGIPSGSPAEVKIQLVDLVFHGEGNGHLTLLTNINNVHIATANGIDANDFYQMGRGDHRHVNWIFTAKGVYEVTLTASFQSGAETLTSPPQTILFAIGLPHMELWLLERGVAPGQLGESDTPASDGVANLVKYALNLPPLEPAASIPGPTFVQENGDEFLALDLGLNPLARDIDVWVETSADLMDWQAGGGHTVTLVQTPSRIHVRDALANSNSTHRFIRLAVERNLPGNDD